jgi:hypothetical protein
MPRRIAGWTLAILAAAVALTYIFDSISVRAKMASNNSSAALGSVQYYPATQLKDGRVDVYYDSPQTETCVHAIFPHYGYNPCWYAKRKSVRLMGRRLAPDNPVATASLARLSLAPQSPPKRKQATQCSI